MTEFENNARKYYRHTDFVVIDQNLNKLYASYNCSFKLYMKDKRGNYELLFRVLAGMTDPYDSRVILYMTPPTNNPEKREICRKFQRTF